MAFSAIRMNLVRAIITIFIIAFGIMSLISMLTAVEGIRAALYSSFASVGSNTFTLKSEDPLKNMGRGFSRPENPRITFRQAEAFQERFNFPGRVSINFNAAIGAVAAYHGIQTAAQITVIGSDQNYIATSGMELEEGRNFTINEVQSGRKVIILGHKLKDDLFGQQDALGKNIKVNGISFMVIGWMKEKGSTFGVSADNNIIIPLYAAQASFPVAEGTNYNLSVQVDNVERMDEAENEAIGVFRAVRKLDIREENDFSITKSESLISALDENVSFLQTFALVVGLITLLGAAIGLTNIMLVTVKERTREIGVRKALGATMRNIRIQFLTEAILITVLGGILGVIFGILLGNVVAQYFDGKFIFPLGWTIFGLALCIVVGVFAGWYPAVKASKLDPIESLRYE